MFFDNINTNLIIIGAVVLILIIIICCSGERGSTIITQDLDYSDDEGPSIQEIIDNRTELVKRCVNVVLNSLEIGSWAENAGIEPKDMFTIDSFVIKGIIFVSITVVPMNLKVTCGLDYDKQRLYVRIEQPLRTGCIQVEDSFKIQAGVISVAQSEKLVAKYLKQVEKRAKVISPNQIENENSEDNEE